MEIRAGRESMEADLVFSVSNFVILSGGEAGARDLTLAEEFDAADGITNDACGASEPGNCIARSESCKVLRPANGRGPQDDKFHFFAESTCPNIKSIPRAPTSARMSAQFFTTQFAPASRTAEAATVVVKPMTRAPAALPARIPAGASSTTTHSVAANPSTAAPFK